jgi:hypothetical protein
MPPPLDRWRRAQVTAAGAAAALAVLGGLGAVTEAGRSAARFAWTRLRGRYSVDERLDEHSAAVRARLAPKFAAAGVAYPPLEVSLLTFKDQRRLDLYARDATEGPWRFVADYTVRGASGRLGPKLREGDLQVPEGVYRAEALNPNSRYHLSIKLDYPNPFDRRMAQADGRDKLGGDVMIHGNRASIGCVAMGNSAAEDLFVLAALVGRENTRIIISPTDFRQPSAAVSSAGPPWLPLLYADLREALRGYALRPTQSHNRR